MLLLLHVQQQDNQPDLGKWGKVPLLINQIEAEFPPGSVLTPPKARELMQARGTQQGQHNSTPPIDLGRAGTTASQNLEPHAPPLGIVPSVEELVALGFRVLVLSGTDYGAEMDPGIFSNITIGALCPYSEAWVRDFEASSEVDGGGRADGRVLQDEDEDDAMAGSNLDDLGMGFEPSASLIAEGSRGDTVRANPKGRNLFQGQDRDILVRGVLPQLSSVPYSSSAAVAADHNDGEGQLEDRGQCRKPSCCLSVPDPGDRRARRCVWGDKWVGKS